MKNVLIVGGGAVGHVYGWALSRAGAKVTYYLKPKNAPQGLSDKGFAVYWLNRDSDRKSPMILEQFRVMTRPEEVASENWDQVYLTVSSTALRTGWLKEFAPAVLNRAKSVIMLQAGLEDRDYLLQYFPESKLVSGMISFFAYPTPLPESQESVSRPGIAFYFPPLSVSWMSGPYEIAHEAAQLLSLGGLTSKYSKTPVLNKMVFPNVLLIIFVSVLERVGWSLEKMKRPEVLKQLVQGIHEASHAISVDQGIPVPLMLKFVTPATLKFVLNAGPKLLPFEVEPMLKAHFIKVGDQTRMMIQEYIQLGQNHGQSMPVLQQFDR